MCIQAVSAPRPCVARVRRSRRALALFADATPEKAALHADQMKTKRSAMAAKESKRRAGAGRKLLAMNCVNESLARMRCHAGAQTWMNLEGNFYQMHGGKARQQKARVSGATEKHTHALRQRRGFCKLLHRVILFSHI